MANETPKIFLPLPRAQMHVIMPGFHVGAGDLNLGPYACIVSTLPTDPSPSLRKVLLFLVLFSFINRGEIRFYNNKGFHNNRE